MTHFVHDDARIFAERVEDAGLLRGMEMSVSDLGGEIDKQRER